MQPSSWICSALIQGQGTLTRQFFISVIRVSSYCHQTVISVNELQLSHTSEVVGWSPLQTCCIDQLHVAALLRGSWAAGVWQRMSYSSVIQHTLSTPSPSLINTWVGRFPRSAVLPRSVCVISIVSISPPRTYWLSSWSPISSYRLPDRMLLLHLPQGRWWEWGVREGQGGVWGGVWMGGWLSWAVF